jgi:hypothetical protein
VAAEAVAAAEAATNGHSAPAGDADLAPEETTVSG